MNTFVFLDKAARFHGDRPAIIHGQEVITYREFHQRALLIAGNLAGRRDSFELCPPAGAGRKSGKLFAYPLDERTLGVGRRLFATAEHHAQPEISRIVRRSG